MKSDSLYLLYYLGEDTGGGLFFLFQINFISKLSNKLLEIIQIINFDVR